MDLDIKIPVFTRGNDGILRKTRESAKKSVANAHEPRPAKGTSAHEPKARKTVEAKPARGSVHALMENWTPHARVLLVARQRCKCCGKAVEYVAGDLIEYTQRDKVAGIRTIRTRAFNRVVDARYAWAALPRRVDYIEDDVDECASCVRVDEIFDNTIGELHTVPLQYGFNFESEAQRPEGTAEAESSHEAKHA